MKLNAFLPPALLAAALLPAGAWAQATGESAETGPAGHVDQPAVRSPLWLTIEAHHRQREAAQLPGDRRLTSAQRQELREQVRRAWSQHEAAPPPSEQSAQR